MDRTEFFKKSQKASVYTNQFKDLSKPILNDCTVYYKDIQYYPQFIKIGYDAQGNVQNIAVLHDLRAKSIIECNLTLVKGGV